MRKAVVAVSAELFLQTLGFPEGTKLIAARNPDAFDCRKLELLIEHEALPDVPEGWESPQITPTFRRGDLGEPVFVSWGIK